MPPWDRNIAGICHLPYTNSIPIGSMGRTVYLPTFTIQKSTKLMLGRYIRPHGIPYWDIYIQPKKLIPNGFPMGMAKKKQKKNIDPRRCHGLTDFLESSIAQFFRGKAHKINLVKLARDRKHDRFHPKWWRV